MTPSVLHVIPALAPRYGGPSVAVVGMCRALTIAGASVLVATTDADGPDRLPVTVGQVQDWEETPTIFFRRRFGESYKWSAGLVHWLQSHVRDFDLVHVHAVFSHASLSAGKACREAGVPYVVRPLGTLDPWSLDRHALRKKVLFRLAARQFLSGASAMHYTSDEERRLAERGMPWLPPGVVVPLGVDERLFDASDRAVPAGPYVLALSRLDAKKGLELLIAAFHGLAHDTTCARWTLVIAGAGDSAYVDRLRQLTHDGAAASRIVFRGWVDGADRAALFQGASLFALPSHQENFGVALAEAMASGVPVLVGPGVNLGRGLEAAGAGWVVLQECDAWHAALVHAMTHDLERTDGGRNARRFAEQFRWPTVAAQLLAMYDRVRHPAAQLGS